MSRVNPNGHGTSRKEIRVAFLTMGDPNDRTFWSGTPYRMARAIEKYCGEVVPVGPFQPFELQIGRVIHRGVKLLTGKTYRHLHTNWLSKKLGKIADAKMHGAPCDVIFAPAGSTLLAHLNASVPVVYLSDATFRLMANYYSDFSNLLAFNARTADLLERLAIERASQLIYPSSWAAESAVRDYGADPSKITVIPFGANLETPPSREDALRVEGDSEQCRLLFVGVNWKRKGGDIAVETLFELERLGIPAELTVVGCKPPYAVKHAHFRVYERLNKNDPHQRQELDRLYKRAHFFVLPTRAECFSIALCEANAYGLPVVSTHTGGLPELVREGVSGFLLPIEARGDQYAARIRDVFRNSTRYQELRAASRDEFETRLNWDAWGKKVKEILLAAVGSGAAL